MARIQLIKIVLTACIAVSVVHSDESDKREWTVDGVKREALVVPPAMQAGTPAPVVFAFHGHGGSMQNSARKFNMENLWPEALLVCMQGLNTPGKFDPSGERAGWQKYVGDQGDRDLKFFDQVLATLKKEYSIDEKRVYATGHSNGGGFTYVLWAARGDVFAAVAPSAGGAGGKIAALRPLPAMHIAGENDERVPYETQKRAMAAIRTLNGCKDEGEPWATAGTLVGTLYSSDSGTPFVSVVYPGGHAFPSEAPDLIVKFFKNHTKK